MIDDETDTEGEQEKAQPDFQDDIKSNTDGFIELKAQELEKSIKIFDTIHKIKKKADPNKGSQMNKELEQRMPRITSTLKEVLQSDAPVTIKNATILKIKDDLLRLMLTSMSDGQGNEAVWRSLRSDYNFTLDHYSILVE